MKKRLVTASAITVLIAGLLGYVGYSIFISPKDSSTDSKNNKKASGTKSASKNENTASDDTGKAANTNEEGQSEYSNNRFGFRVSYPSTWSKTESNNGDGATFVPTDEKKVVIRAYGYTVGMKTLDEMIAEQESYERLEHSDLSIVAKNNSLLDGHPAIEATWSYTAVAADTPLSGNIRKRLILTRKDEAGIVLEMIGEASTVDSLTDDFNKLVEGFGLQ